MTPGMRDDKWNEIKAMVKTKFKAVEEGRYDLEYIPNAYVEFISFDSPQGKMKLERTTQPVVLDKKTIYSKLGGSASKIEYSYSPDEVSHRFKAYKWSDGLNEWEEVKAPPI
ncbi:MAG: hypothetical protein UX17_C0008G0004 [Parcubacteria group bacterium GW2011_GWC2_45_7]|nr:MAG: hypothetical protein UX17_C0008G0004 [Parcubacteria group bacterium GW2011_GWC2_45_7]KKU73351.1 MAG: hypothetical protein UX98_C0008G0017 [Parcubacteria group bacterium GW2011_GWA2_47_26]